MLYKREIGIMVNGYLLKYSLIDNQQKNILKPKINKVIDYLRIFKMGRKIHFENVVKNLRFRRTAYTKIVQADYSNLGDELFDHIKFADNLGVTSKFLQNIGLVVKKNYTGWNLLRCPTAEQLLKFESVIKKEVSKYD